jgi:hypothetical protein
MGRIVTCQMEAWHQFQSLKDSLFADNLSLVIIPEGEDKGRIAGALSGPGIRDIQTIPDCLAGYVKKRRGKGILSRKEAESILGAIISDSLTPYLNIERYKQSYVKVLTDFIHGFRSTSLVDLRQAIAGLKTEQLSLKEKDLVKIHREYEQRLPSHGFDLRSALEELITLAGAGDLNGLPGCGKDEQVILFGFDHVTPLEEEFIFTVFKHANSAFFFFCHDSAASEQSTRIHKSIAALIKRLDAAAVRHEQPPPEDSFFAAAARALFKPERPEMDPGAKSRHSVGPPERHEAVVITDANSRVLEVAAMARRIRRLAETGVPLRDIRIAAPAYRLYSAVIGEVFPDYGIPFSLEQGVPLMRFPLAALILHLATQSISPNPYPLREKIFASPYVSFTAEITSACLLEFQEKASAAYLPGERLPRLIKPGESYSLDYNFLKNLRAVAYRSVKPAPGTPQAVVMKRYLDGLAKEIGPAQEEFRCRYLIQAYLQAQAEKRLDAWQTRMSGAEFAGALRGLLQRFRIAENINTGAGAGSREAHIAARDMAVLKRVEQLLTEMAKPPSGTGGPTAGKPPLVELVRAFTRLMNEAIIAAAEFASPAAGDEVTIQAADRGQYRQWPYTFICGMVDGEFPAREEFNFLQPKKEGLGLSNLYTSVDHGRNRFYQLVRSTTRGLYLSRPLSDQGKKLPPSPFLKEMRQWAGTPPEAAGAGQANTGDSRLYSRREKLSWIARQVDRAYEQALPLLKELAAEDEALYQKITAMLRFDGLTLSAASFSEFDGIFWPALAPTREAAGISGAATVTGAARTAASASAAAALLDAIIREINFTPAILERYATCPMRFFFDDILRLRREPDYHPDTAEAGRLAHAILKEYTAAACAAGGIPESAPQLLQELARKHLQELEREQGDSDAFRLRFINSLTARLDDPAARRPGLLRAFLDYETEGPDYLRPFWAGVTGTVTLQGELEIGLELDRVDITEAGDYLLPYFYTAAPPGDPKRISRGLRFDLPLAVLLCENYAAERRVHLPAAGAGLYLVKNAKNLRRGGYFAMDEIRATRRDQTSPVQPVFSGQREGFYSREEFAAALWKIQQHLLRLHRLIKSGVFHLPLGHESEQSCNSCSFQRACRKDQLRLERLKRAYSMDAAAGEQVHLVSEIF